MFEFMLNKLSTHAQFSLFAGTVFGVMALIVSGAVGFSIAKTVMVTIIVTAVLYLALDFYEHFVESE